MKEHHDGDCTIYASLSNEYPESGICTCGYGLEQIRRDNHSELYSRELQEKLERENKLSEAELEKILEDSEWKR